MKQVFVYSNDSNTYSYGAKVIIDNLKKTLNGYNVIVTDRLDETSLNSSILISLTINNCFDAIKFLNKKSINIAFLIDAASLCVISAAKNYILRRDYFSLISLRQMLGLFLRFFLYTYKESKIFKNYDYIVLTSEVDKEYLSKKYNDYKDKIIVIPNGVEIRKFSESYPKEFTLGFLTTFSDGAFEDMRWFLDSYFPKIKKVHQDLRIIIAGRGATEKMKNYFQKIKEVEFIGEVNDLINFFDKITVMVTTVRKECGMLNKILDSFVYKKVVIGSSKNFKAFINLENGDGYLACDTVDDYINAISILKGNPALFQKLTDNAFNYVVKYHNWDKNYQVLKDIVGNIYI